MKKIEAIVRPEKVGDIRKALERAGYPGLTISEVEGHGKQRGVTQQWRGETYRVELLPKVKIEIVASARDVDRIVKTVMETARTGQVGDGKLFVSEVEEVVRIRTGEKGEQAV